MRWRPSRRSRVATCRRRTPAGRCGSCSRRTRPAGPRRCRWRGRTPVSSSPSTRAPPTAAIPPGCGTCRSRCFAAVMPSRPASDPATSRCGSAMPVSSTSGWTTWHRRSAPPTALQLDLGARSTYSPTTRRSRAIARSCAMPESAVRIALVFPSLLGTYGDGGNASVLAQRLRWRDIDAELVDVGVDDAVPEQADLYVLGGGEDTAQTLAVSRLSDGVLSRAVDAGKTLFAVCAGFQILGESFLVGAGEVVPGLGLVDCRTDRLPGERAVGELLTDAGEGLGVLTGYENHGGRTLLGPDARPLGRVRDGIGNGDGSGCDGLVQGNVIATYLHGPALARNPALADHLLTRVIGDALSPLDDHEEEELRAERFGFLRRARRTSRWRRQWRPPARDL